MLPQIWGEVGWDFFHFVTLGYPENPTNEDKKNYYQYFHHLKYVLPCFKCRTNMENHLKKYPLTDEVLSSRTNLVKWGIDFHNIVNYYTGKPILSYQEAIDNISRKIRHRINRRNKKIHYYIFFLIIITTFIFLVCCIYLKKN